ncbi:hypothetical protein OS493_012239 [Desmophyllum pertusum]|uniref:Uncharacterized protein n=1 Tax=Desmophyllum pertusum TaxID=174260 RepID=A0A9W9ZQF0_9CNID|nr:hypothetical protein OS493_012239 [Desmophyllum pertusum]
MRGTSSKVQKDQDDLNKKCKVFSNDYQSGSIAYLIVQDENEDELLKDDEDGDTTPDHHSEPPRKSENKSEPREVQNRKRRHSQTSLPAEERIKSTEKAIQSLKRHSDKGTCPSSFRYTARANIKADDDFIKDIKHIRKKTEQEFVKGLTRYHYRDIDWSRKEIKQGKRLKVPQAESMQVVTFLQTFTRHTKCHYYNSMVLSDKKPNLSGQIQYSSVTPNDGDGLVMNIDIHADNPLKNALFTRLNGIDAPELYTVHFIKTDNLQHVFSKRVGNLNLCALHLFLHVFNADNAELCEEIPREGFDLPVDVYDCPLKEFWFKFHTTPLAQAHNFITLLENMLSSKPELRKRLMSPFRISTATETTFLLSLNALLVVTDFCHVFPKYCQDKLLLGLQGLAKQHKMGPLWCGASQNCTLECKTENTEDFVKLYQTSKFCQASKLTDSSIHTP